MAKRTKITNSKYMQALALFTVSHKHYVKSREMELELAELLGYDDDYAGCISDQIYEGGNFNEGMKLEGITVLPKKAKRK